MKKILITVLSLIMMFTCCLMGAGCGEDLKDSHIFMFKSTGNTFGDLMADGFSAYMTANGEKSAYKSPAKTDVTSQVEMIEKLIKQGVKSITISTNGDSGYDTVIKKANDAGVVINSIDSALSPSLRGTHVVATLAEDIGSALVRAAVLIALQKEYPANFSDSKATVTTALASYSGAEIKLGVLSAGQTTVVQNTWIKWMNEELKDDIYTGKVNKTLTIKYGNDDMTESTTQANAFISEANVDVIISPTTVGMLAAGRALKQATSSKIKLTGLGLPSEMSEYMPTSTTTDVFSTVCPYMFLWNVIDLGAVGAATTLAMSQGKFDGKIGSTFTMSAYSANGENYAQRTFTCVQDPDNTATGATAVVALDPFMFNKANIESWKVKL